MVNVLLSRGANVHQKDLYGQTALHFATSRCSNVFRRIFTEAGPRAMNFPTWNRTTPLHWLVRCGSAEQMAFALSHPGIDVSIRSHDGRAALEGSGKFLSPLQTYRDQEARWQPMRYTWIKLLILPS
jgi:ankyrin repeat protein